MVSPMLTCVNGKQLPLHGTSIVTMGLSRTVSEVNSDFGRKSHIFPTLCTRGVPLEFCTGGGLQKLKW